MTGKVQLNDDKTKAMLRSSSRLSESTPSSVYVCQTSVAFSYSVRNLGVYFDNDLSRKEHVNFICKIAFLELRRIGTVRHYLILDATEILVVSFVLSRIDYCNFLLVGLPGYLIQKLQRDQNCAARLVLHYPSSSSVKSLVKQLLWLPVKARIDYKTACLRYNAVNSCTCTCVALRPYSSPRSIPRSACDTLLHKLPMHKCKSRGDRAFFYVGLNSLPFFVRNSTLSNLANRLSNAFLNLFNIHLCD